MATPDLVGIIVKDMAAALKFYRLLGLDIPTKVDGELYNKAMAATKNRGMRFGDSATQW